jgi:hypothetical protein
MSAQSELFYKEYSLPMKLSTITKKLVLTAQALTMALGFGVASMASAVVVAAPAYAAQSNCTGPNDADPLSAGAACSQANGTRDNLFAPNGIFVTVANTLIFLVGAIAVIFLIIGGLRYVVSQGDSKNIEAAKNTILYAIVGIIVAVISFALVQFVITSLNKAQ